MAPEEGDEERRWSYRRSIELEADITDISGETRAATLSDLSEDGCQIEVHAGPDLAVDDLYDIAIVGFDPLGAQVVWAAQGKSGLTFTTPLTSAEVEKLVMTSLYARLTRRAPSAAPSDGALDTLPPFPFED